MGHQNERDGRERTASRIESAVTAVIYVGLAVVAFRVVTGSSKGGQGGEAFTAKLLKMTGGQFIVALAGIMVVVAAVTFDPQKARGLDAALRQPALTTAELTGRLIRRPGVTLTVLDRPLRRVWFGCVGFPT